MGEREVAALRVEHITKRFPGTLALNDVQMETKHGEVHVLLGENGAGKSTLMKIVSGIYTKDSGSIYIDGVETEIKGVKDAESKGISIVHQELNLLQGKTVYQNVFLGEEPFKNKLLQIVDEKRMIRETQQILDELGLDIDPCCKVSELSIAKQQMVEVAKALHKKTKILILDEPTSSLTRKEITALFEIVRRLRKENISIIYISHRMEEIYEIGDRITVFRDGCYVGTRNVADTEMDEIITMMVGRKIENMYNKSERELGEVALKTENLTGRRFRNCNIEVHRGEVVSLSGLVGAGRTELAKAIFGYDPILGGKVYLKGKELTKHSPKASVRAGMAYLSEDRKTEGIILQMPISNNIVQSCLNTLFPRFFINKKKEMEYALQFSRKLKLNTEDLTRKVSTLSGGNQQKVAVAKWLAANCDVVIFDEPTRGIDVGAKHEIYEIIDDLAKQGSAILIVSSDQLEVLGISDKTYVMNDGEIVAELSGDEITQEKIVEYSVSKKGGAAV